MKLTKFLMVFFLVLGFLMSFLACSGGENEFIPVERIENVIYEAVIGIENTLTATVYPSKATNKKIIWEVVDDGDTGAVIDGNILTADKLGFITVEARIINGLAKGSDFFDEFNIDLVGISLNFKERSIQLGSNFTLTAVLDPGSSGGSDLTWTSEDPSVASVTPVASPANSVRINGLKTGGPVKITVTSEESGYSAFCDVTVTAVAVISVTLDETEIQLAWINKTGAAPTIQLTATVLPETADNKINWTSSDTAVAKVEDGLVTAVDGGKAVITATSAADSSKKATCEVEVLTTYPESPIIEDLSTNKIAAVSQSSGGLGSNVTAAGWTFNFMEWGGLSTDAAQPGNSDPPDTLPSEMGGQKVAAWCGNDEFTSIERRYPVANNLIRLKDTLTNVAFHIYCRAGTSSTDWGGGREMNAPFNTDNVPAKDMFFELHRGQSPDIIVYKANIPGPRRIYESTCLRWDSGWVDLKVPLANFVTTGGAKLIDAEDLIITGWKFTTNQEKLHIFLNKIQLMAD